MSVDEQFVERFLLAQSVTRGIDPTILLHEWKTYLVQHKDKPNDPSPGVSPSPPTKRQTAYQRFFSETSSRLKQEDPSITFRDISKRASAIWNSMSPDLKKQYSVAEKPNDTSQTVVPVLDSDLRTCTMDTLAQMCKERGLSKRGNKDTLIQRILAQTVPAQDQGANPLSHPEPIRNEEDEVFSMLENLGTTHSFGKTDTTARKREKMDIHRIVVPHTREVLPQPSSTPMIAAILDETLQEDTIVPDVITRPPTHAIEDTMMDGCQEKDLDGDDILELESTTTSLEEDDDEDVDDETGDQDDDLDVGSIMSDDPGMDPLENDYGFD